MGGKRLSLKWKSCPKCQVVMLNQAIQVARSWQELSSEHKEVIFCSGETSQRDLCIKKEIL